MKRILNLSVILALVFVILACQFGPQGSAPGSAGTPAPLPTLESSPFQPGRTAYGFFPSPPEASLESILSLYRALGQHADVVLLQQSVPWQDFASSPDVESQAITDIRNQYILARQNGLEVIFVVDALNGLNRTEFARLPFGWQASFGNPQVRAAFTNFTLRVLREFQPRYLGLASEINTYADAHNDDFANYLSLYREVYDKVKATAPETRVFATFQWEDLNNLGPFPGEGRQAYQVNWEQIEVFEPKLDVWAISSYPFVVFKHGADIPANYYTALLKRTQKPLAVAEGGYTSQPVGAFAGTPQDQVDTLKAIHNQLGSRLDFWIYLLLRDFNLDSYAKMMKQQGQERDIQSLGMFTSVGLSDASGAAKPGLEYWDTLRQTR